MPKASDLKPDGRFFGMFVGPSGGGKSTASVSFPFPFNLDMDMRIRGILSAKSYIDLDKVQYKTFNPSQGFKEVENELEILGNLIVKNQSPTKTVILDSLTTELRMFLTDGTFATGPDGKYVKIRQVSSLRMPGPSEYNIEAEGTYQIFDFLRALPINVIVTAHTMPVYGKEDPTKEYSPSVIVGSKLSIRDRIAANVLIYFDEVYEFDREMNTNGSISHYVRFRSSIAKTTHNGLVYGRHDITGKNFYEFWRAKVNPSPEVTPISIIK